MTTAIATSPTGQDHDRLDLRDTSSIPSISMEDGLNGHGGHMDITPFQKMISATTGSLLTGLTSTLNNIIIKSIYKQTTNCIQ